jgi:hypothetical protein
MNRQHRKQLVKELVATRQLPALNELAKRDKRVVGVLCALLYEQDDLFRWRAIEALGSVAAVVADTDLQSVRELVRRLEWLMNDESGGAGWHSPEAMAAIVVNVPSLLDVFGVLLGSYLSNDGLNRGAHWAVAAVAKVRPNLFADKVDELTASLESDDPFIRGYAVIALSLLAGNSLAERTENMRDDAGELDLYTRDTGELRTTTVGALVRLLTPTGSDQRESVDVW